jgi:hypothetical protein
LNSITISNADATTVDRDAAEVDFWALTRPSSLSADFVALCRRTHAALGFASFGPWDTSWRSVAGASRRVHRPSPFRFRRLSALELRRIACLAGTPLVHRTKACLMRLRFSDSVGRCLVPPAWRYPTPDELPV